MPDSQNFYTSKKEDGADNVWVRQYFAKIYQNDKNNKCKNKSCELIKSDECERMNVNKW